MIVIASVFWKWKTVKDLIRPLSKKHRLRTPFGSESVKGSQTLVKSEREHFHHIFSSLLENLIWKISPLVICQMVGWFCNTLTANDKYPVWDCENLSSPIQTELCLKRKNEKLFLIFLFPFWNLHQILNTLKITMIVIAPSFPKLQTVKELVWPLSKKRFSEHTLRINMLKDPKVL